MACMLARLCVLLCANPRCDTAGVVPDLEKRARDFCRQQRLRADVFAVGCLDLCGRGPHVVVHGAPGTADTRHHAPDGGVAYDSVDAAALDRILLEHVVGGRPVETHLHDPLFRR